MTYSVLVLNGSPKAARLLPSIHTEAQSAICIRKPETENTSWQTAIGMTKDPHVGAVDNALLSSSSAMACMALKTNTLSASTGAASPSRFSCARGASSGSMKLAIYGAASRKTCRSVFFGSFLIVFIFGIISPGKNCGKRYVLALAITSHIKADYAGFHPIVHLSIERLQVHIPSAADKELCQQVNAVLNVLERAYLGRIMHIANGNGYQGKGNANSCLVHGIAICTGMSAGSFNLD